jgi:dienelactone hydrolase
MGPWVSKLTILLLVALTAATLLPSLNVARHAAGWTLVEDTPEERVLRLEPHWRRVAPEQGPPSGAAVLLSGCDGPRDNMDYWAAQLVADGRAALIVDSHAPRGLDRLAHWRFVCMAQALPGAQRAGDLAVALAEIEADDVVLLGASHGGWSIMEFVQLAATGETPPGLTRWPTDPGGLLHRVSAIVLLYPYCGMLNGAEAPAWAEAPPTLMVLAAQDSVVSTPACLERAMAFSAAGGEVEVVTVADADHGFDQKERSVFSTLSFDADKRAEARAAVADFLGRHAATTR